MRVAFDCAQQLLVVQQTSNSSATRSQNIFATLKAKGGAGPPCQLADCAYTDFGVPLGASLPQVWNPEEISNPARMSTACTIGCAMQGQAWCGLMHSCLLFSFIKVYSGVV